MGEQQLFALVRALVTKSPLLILDEATSRYVPQNLFILVLIISCSSVDHETEAIMHNIIEREFDTQTVIAVMHRLRHVERFDKVVLMKQGKIVEFDSPQALLTRPSEFRLFYRARQTN